MQMPERELNRRSVLVGPVHPVPASPYWAWFDTWEVSSLQLKTWRIDIPNDNMAYKLCNYYHAMQPTGWVYCALRKNGTIFYNQQSGYYINYSPGSPNAPVFAYPDYIHVQIVHAYASYSVNHYWEMDFWREPIG